MSNGMKFFLLVALVVVILKDPQLVSQFFHELNILLNG